MKKLIIFLLLTYTSLFAKEIAFTIPIPLQVKLCDILAQDSNRCENGSTIDYYKHLVLADDRLLIYLYLNEHAENYGVTRNTIPVVVNSRGQWQLTKGENSIGEDIESLHQDPHNNIWVRAIWHVEGVYPALYHSADAIHWKRTKLPENRNVDCCFESIDAPIFQSNRIKLTFRDLDNIHVKSWATTYQNAMSNQPNWQAVPNEPRESLEKVHKGNWKIDQTKKKITFLNTRSHQEIALPIGESKYEKIYHIQLGAFLKKSSADVVSKSLGEMPYRTFTKTMVINNKKYIKLLIGSFTSKRKAQFILSKIKKEHQTNKSIQKAFILTTKP